MDITGQRWQRSWMCFLLIGFAYADKIVYSQQARSYRSCLLATDGYINRIVCITCNGKQRDISIQALLPLTFRVGRRGEVFYSDSTR